MKKTHPIKTIKAWAVKYKSSMGYSVGLEWRCCKDYIDVMYPRIFMSRKDAEDYIKATKNEYLKVIPLEIQNG